MIKDSIGKLFFPILLNHVFLYNRAALEEVSLSTVPGMSLLTENSAVCQETSLGNLNNFYLDSFLQLKEKQNGNNLIRRSTIFFLKDTNCTFELSYSLQGVFFIKYKNKTFIYPKHIEFNDWTKLSIMIENGKIVKFDINYRLTRNSSHEGTEEDSAEKNEHGEHLNSVTNKSLPSNLLPKSPISLSRIILCIGNYEDGKSSIVGSVAGVTVASSDTHYISKPDKENWCYRDNDFQNALFSDDDYTALYGNVTKQRYNLKELCWGTHVFLLFEVQAKYDEHFHLCQRLNGRLLYHAELLIFSENLAYLVSNRQTSTKQTKNEIQYSDQWLVGGTKGANNLTIYCPVSKLMSAKASSRPCIAELNYTFCTIPKYSDFYYYGPLIKYDIFYTLQEKNGHIFLRGDEGTLLDKQNGNWSFHSELHEESVMLHNAILPVGRHMWNDQVSQYLLTFTYCQLDKFTCSTGDCLPIEARCNGTVECLDASDEKECVLINKKTGYSINRTPPHRKNESIFTVKYYAHIFNIADISSLDGIAVVDANISMTWFDPRIRFKNPVIDEDVECADIWWPQIAMADGSESGFQIKFESYRSSCIVLSSQLGLNPARTRDERDPYNGQYVDGEDLPVSYMFAGLITVPCRFNLRKYPFGIQTCNITFWADNALLTSNYKMESYFPSTEGDVSSKELKYFGRKTLGEFYFVSATHFLCRSDRMVTLSIKLKSLYGFHMLNSFTPSFLISIIAYSTIFFPIQDFNERIMVSLTALVVMAVFFTQASNTSVRTPYFKFLDIWHVVLIIFCFFIVIANAMIRKIENYEKILKIHVKKSGQELCEKGSDDHKDDNSSPSKKINMINIFFEIIFAAFLIVFITFYSLAAAEIL